MADDLRAQLVKVLWDAPYDQEDQADALLPVVRAYAAQQLRDAADDLQPHENPYGLAGQKLRARAEDLDRG